MLMRRDQPQDPCFPTLARALDPGEVANVLARDLALAGYAARQLDVEIERVRLKPGRKALLGYRLTGRDARGRPIDQRLMMTLWPNGLQRDLPVVVGEASVTPVFGPALLDCADLRGSAWFFPNDRKIRGITRLLEQASGYGDVFEVVHYVPEQGCTVRVSQGAKSLFGKARVDERCDTAASIAASSANQGEQGLRLAKLVAHDPEIGIMWQEAVEGEPLQTSRFLEYPAQWSGQAARAIAAFHGLVPDRALAELSAGALIDRLEARVPRIRQTFPALAPDLTILASQLAANAPTDGRNVLAHCDLHPANLLWDGQSFALIDLDTCALAPAALDHASLAAAIAQKAFGKGHAPEEVWKLVCTFKDAAHEAEAIAPGHFAWHLAICLVTERLYRCGTRLKSTHPGMPRQLLGLATMALTERGSSNV